MHHSFGDQLAYASLDRTLRAGELIGSGTAPGGAGVEDGRFLAPGDVIEMEVEGNGLHGIPSGHARERSDMFVVPPTYTANEGEEEAIRAIGEEMAPLSRAEPGCVFYQRTGTPRTRVPSSSTSSTATAAAARRTWRRRTSTSTS